MLFDDCISIRQPTRTDRASAVGRGAARAGRTARRRGTGAAAFSLIEVNLAIMIIAVGLLVLFSLFPAGLKQGESAYRDTQAGLFADYIFSAIRMNVENIDSWADWSAIDTFTALAVDGLTVSGVPIVPTASSVAIEFPEGSGNHVRYILEIRNLGARRSAALWVWGSRFGPTSALFKKRSHWVYTEYYYTGGPDA
jgi:hypothetical protein